MPTIVSGYFTIPWPDIEKLREANLDRYPLTIALPGVGGRISATVNGVIVQWSVDPSGTPPLTDPTKFSE